MTVRIPEKTTSVKIQVPEPEESRSGDDTSTPQRLASVVEHPNNHLYIDSGTSIHILFNKEVLGGIVNLDTSIKIQAGGKLIHLSQIGSLHQALRHLPLPVSTYHYSENAIANLLSFAKLADDYYIICNTRIDNAIYVQSKDDCKYLWFQRDHKFDLYYMDISKADGDEYCYLNTVKQGRLFYSILDQKRAEAVRILQERCAFPSDKDFINALECNYIEGMDFGRRDVKISNDIYGSSKGAAMGRFKYSLKGVKMDRTTENLAAHVPPTIMEYYSDIHLDIDILFVNKIPFLLATSQDIGFIHYKALLSKHGKCVQNGQQQIILDYQVRGFKVVSMFGDEEFEPLVNWVQSKLHIDLVTCAADSHVLRAENAIRFVKERVRAIQSETPFDRYPKRFIIEMLKRVVVLINSFRRKSGVHPVMSSRQILFGKKFKTLKA